MHVIECQIDDMTGEALGYTMERLISQSNILDAFYTSIHMKKNRPGVLLTVLVEKENLEETIKFIFESTTTLGVRYYPVNRTILHRNFESISTDWGSVQFKKGYYDNQLIRVTPEYEDMKKISTTQQIPFLMLQQKMMDIAYHIHRKENDIDFFEKE